MLAVKDTAILKTPLRHIYDLSVNLEGYLAVDLYNTYKDIHYSIHNVQMIPFVRKAIVNNSILIKDECLNELMFPLQIYLQ